MVNLEKTDARILTADLIPETPELVVCDASFIGLAKVLPAALELAADDADLIALVKPQFEGDGPKDAGKKGVVKDAQAHADAVRRVSEWLATVGWTVQASTESPITGGDGNIEFLLWARRANQPSQTVATQPVAQAASDRVASDSDPSDKEKPPVDCSTGGRHDVDRQGG